MGTALAERPLSSPDTLTDKQQAFLIAYTEQGDTYLNAMASARVAGYAHPHVAGTEVLANPRVRLRVREALKNRARSPEEIIAKLETWMDADLGDCIDITEDGGWRLNLVKAKELGKLGAIDTLKGSKYGTEIKLKSSLQAAEVLAKVHRLFGDQPTVVVQGETDEGKRQLQIDIACTALRRLHDEGKVTGAELFAKLSAADPGAAANVLRAMGYEPDLPLAGMVTVDERAPYEAGEILPAESATEPVQPVAKKRRWSMPKDENNA